MSQDVKLTERRRRALYRACHRGTKEMDWLLGRFARASLAAMSDRELTAFERLLGLPDPEVERWIMHHEAPRPAGQIGEFIVRLRRFHGLDRGPS